MVGCACYNRRRYFLVFSSVLVARQTCRACFPLPAQQPASPASSAAHPTRRTTFLISRRSCQSLLSTLSLSIVSFSSYLARRERRGSCSAPAEASGKLPVPCATSTALPAARTPLRRLFAAARGLTGNLPPLPYVYPGQLTPTVRATYGRSN